VIWDPIFSNAVSTQDFFLTAVLNYCVPDDHDSPHVFNITDLAARTGSS
jgi:hypothetical protein